MTASASRSATRMSLIAPGPHTYTLTYATDRQIGFFSDYDELYWNVTGNFWKFPIDHAEATIKLPFGAKIMQLHCLYRRRGFARLAMRAAQNNSTDREILFATTAPLGAERGPDRRSRLFQRRCAAADAGRNCARSSSATMPPRSRRRWAF